MLGATGSVAAQIAPAIEEAEGAQSVVNRLLALVGLETAFAATLPWIGAAVFLGVILYALKARNARIEDPPHGQNAMIGLVTKLLTGLGRRAVFWGAILGTVLVALWIAFRRGRRQGEAEFVIRRADARILSLQTAKEVYHEVENAGRADLERRAERWMRD